MDGRANRWRAVAALVGLWLLVGGFALGSRRGAFTTAALAGGLLAVLAVVRLVGRSGRTWWSWVDLPLGVWLILSPWALDFTPSRGMTAASLLVGLVLVVQAVMARRRPSAFTIS